MDGDGKQNWCFMVSKLRLHGTMQQGLCFYTYVISKIIFQTFSEVKIDWDILTSQVIESYETCSYVALKMSIFFTFIAHAN